MYACCTCDIFLLKSNLLFIWNWNITGCPVFLFVKSGNPTREVSPALGAAFVHGHLPIWVIREVEMCFWKLIRLRGTKLEGRAFPRLETLVNHCYYFENLQWTMAMGIRALCTPLDSGLALWPILPNRMGRKWGCDRSGLSLKKVASIF